jgi:hypothetical protein
MKIGAFLHSVSNGLKTNAIQEKQEKSTSEVLLADYKAEPSSGVQSVFDKYQIKPTSENMKQVSSFMSSAKGTEAEKLQTLDIALYKGIEPTRDNLMTMHQAVMHDDEVVGALVEVDVEADPITGEAAKKVIDALKLPAHVKAALKREIDNGASLKEAAIAVARAINSGVNGSGDNRVGDKSTGVKIDQSLAKIIKAIEAFAVSKPEVLAQIMKANVGNDGNDGLSQVASALVVNASTINQSATVQSDANQSVLDLNESSSNHSNINQSSLNQSNSNQSNIDESSINESKSQSWFAQSQSNVNNASSNQTDTTTNADSVSADSAVVDAKEPSESSSSLTTSESDMSDDALLALMNDMVETLLENTGATLNTLMETMSLKTYLVETTTEATMRAKTTFETFRAETSSLLKAAVAPQNEAAMAGNLSKVIEKLNQIILKSDVTLFTDMFTEKKLLLMASDLDKAQELTRQGDLSKAQSIVKSAIGLLEQIKFNPSQRRVQVFAQTKIEQLTETLEKPEKTTVRLDAHIKHQLEQTRDVQGSKMARDILETMRFLGLNHEMEVAESLENNDFETTKDWNQSNVKEILLKLMKEEVKDRPIESAQQNLMNLSGQQMMNDSGSREQPFYFFNLPIMDGEELGNMKVYMKGASKSQQMDWKNAELYFGVTLKASGPLGIKVKIQQQKVTLQVMGDDLSGIRKPLERVMEELESFGFSKGDVSFSGYSKDTGIAIKPQLETSKGAQNFTNDGKGFDFKI